MEAKESIEIPFGAFDSELKGWEYTIPEGMEAEIKDGKIIVREKESEDEKIRKALISILKSDFDGDTIIYGTSVSDIIAWLEKQGEQKDSVVDFKAEDWYVSKIDGKIHNIYHSVDKVKPKFHEGDWLEKQGSQNLANSAKTCKVEQKPAWSEEDEIGFHDAMWAIEQARTIAKDENDMGNLWYAEKFLKSLKERYTWKPSDKQLDGIKCAIKTLQYQLNVGDKRLDSLYNDLKNLKG